MENFFKNVILINFVVRDEKMERYFKVEESKDYSIKLRSCVGMLNPESEYIGVMPNDSENIIFFRTMNLSVTKGVILMNPDQRRIMNCSKNFENRIYVNRYLDDIGECESCNIIINTLIHYKPGSPKIRLKNEELNNVVLSHLIDTPIFTGLEITVKINKDMYILQFNGFKENSKITSDTIIKWFTEEDNIAIGESDYGENMFSKYLESGGDGNFFKCDVSDESISSLMGGFLNKFKEINENAFNSRLLPKNVRVDLDIKHVRGLLLYGPPGTGKSMIALQLAKMINHKDLKIVSGPEIFDKFVGGSEANIREIFAPAKLYENESDLLIIIMDEADSICQKRSDGSNVDNKVLNTLLTEIDGVNKKNNIFLILTTNRKDMMDEALFRPGRIELSIEIGLPNESDRLEILQVHTNKLRKTNRLKNVNLEEISKLTTNYTGAELNALVIKAINIAAKRNIIPGTNRLTNDDIYVTQQDMLDSLEKIKPMFGTNSKELDIINQNNFSLTHESCTVLEEIKNYLLNCTFGLNKFLFLAKNGYGKTRLLSHIVTLPELTQKYKFIKYINSWISHKEYKSGYDELVNLGIESSLLIFDSIEDLILFCGINNSYSNIHVQSLYRLLSINTPPNIIITIVLISSNNTLSNTLNLPLKVNQQLSLF